MCARAVDLASLAASRRTATIDAAAAAASRDHIEQLFDDSDRDATARQTPVNHTTA